MNAAVYSYLSDVFKLVYGIVGFLILAGIPIGMLVKAIKGRGDIL